MKGMYRKGRGGEREKGEEEVLGRSAQEGTKRRGRGSRDGWNKCTEKKGGDGEEEVAGGKSDQERTKKKGKKK